MIDIALLAGTVVTKLLAPVFRAGWDKVFDAATDELGSDVADGTKGLVSTVWAKLRGAFTSDEEKAALTSFEKRPDAAAPLVEAMLKEKLEADGALAEQLDRLLNERPGGGTLNGAQIVAHTVNQVVAQGPVSGNAVVAGQYFGAPPAGAAGTAAGTTAGTTAEPDR